MEENKINAEELLKELKPCMGEQDEQEWIAKAVEAGIEKGRADAMREIARTMKQHGDDINYIAMVTGLSQEEILGYDRYWDAISTAKTLASGKYKDGLDAGLKKGRAEGEKIGIEKGREEG